MSPIAQLDTLRLTISTHLSLPPSFAFEWHRRHPEIRLGRYLLIRIARDHYRFKWHLIAAYLRRTHPTVMGILAREPPNLSDHLTHVLSSLPSHSPESP